MNKGKIIFYDDDPDFFREFRELMDASNFEIIEYSDLNELRKHISDIEQFKDVKVLIFDLAKNSQEGGLTKGFEILSDIDEKYHNYRIPIFIHSAFANDVDKFNNCGTVWKIEKSGTSLSQIADIIKKLDESGFIEAFSPGGIIEQNLFAELHKSFTEQFRSGEIEKVISSLKKDSSEQHRRRSIMVFKRIAIRSLLSMLMIDRTIEDESYNEEKISAVEHYIRRINLKHVPIWTGDIFEKKDNSCKLIILTPRCDVASKEKEELLVCMLGDAIDMSKKNAMKFIKDNISPKRYRYLPDTPVFSGGRVDLSSQWIIKKSELIGEFKYIITLSDDLTNEILGKYCSYLLRTSIPEVDEKELVQFLSKNGKE